MLHANNVWAVVREEIMNIDFAYKVKPILYGLFIL